MFIFFYRLGRFIFNLIYIEKLRVILVVGLGLCEIRWRNYLEYFFGIEVFVFIVVEKVGYCKFVFGFRGFFFEDYLGLRELFCLSWRFFFGVRFYLMIS